MRILAALIVSLLLPLSFASPAEATRPIVGYDYPDVCKNIKGHQPIYMVVGATARYEFKQKRNGRYFKHKCVAKRFSGKR